MDITKNTEPLTLAQYQTLAMRTNKAMSMQMMLMHAAMGIASDGGEAVDVIKAHTIYNKPLDTGHLVEELGDLLWFVALAANTIGYNLENIARHNVEKLQRRYPDKYSDELAIARLDKRVDVGSGG